MSSSLRQLQENFQAYILEQNDEVPNVISTEQSSAIERINIYKKGYSLRLVEILEKDFPILRQYIGEERFEAIGQDYIKAYPSKHYNICLFSRYFSSYLIEANYEPHWAEMAAFEWALSCALDAADGEHIGMDQLASVAPESWPYIEFDFHPSAKLYQFRFNAPQIVYAIMLNQEIPALLDYEQQRDWVIWRYHLQSYFESITKEQVWMISAIREGKNFSEICEGLCQWLPEEEVALFAAGSLRNWIEKGLFSTVRIQELVTA